MARPTLKSFKEEALKCEGVRQGYDELSAAYEVRRKLIALRQEAGSPNITNRSMCTRTPPHDPVMQVSNTSDKLATHCSQLKERH